MNLGARDISHISAFLERNTRLKLVSTRCDQVEEDEDKQEPASTLEPGQVFRF